MEFEWDAALVFYDDLAVTVSDKDADEERFVTLGIDALGRLLVVVYTWRGEPQRAGPLAGNVGDMKASHEKRV